MPAPARSLVVVALAVLGVTPAAAQDPPPSPWTLSIGAGLAVTSGNTDTTNLNLTLKAAHDPKGKTVFSLDGIYVRGAKDGEMNADNALANTRMSYTFGPRAFVFGQIQYLRDTFKQIDAFVAPTAGVGYRLVDSEKGSFSVDASLGASWEKNSNGTSTANPVIVIGQKLTRSLSKTAAFSQAVAGTIVANDASDALYTFSAGIAAALTGNTQIKVEVLDTYKTKPSAPGVQKNDVSTVFAVVYKF